MNLVIETIKKRQSVRLYEPKPIPKDIINTIIEAAHQAPFMSEKRFQPWRFVVVEDPVFKQQLIQTIEPFRSHFVESMKETNPEMYAQAMRLYEALPEPKDLIYYSAPVIIFVIAPTQNSIGSAMVCQNIITAAGSFGLGSCYVGFGAMIKGNSKVVQTLELTEDERIYGPILLGYPKINPSKSQVSALAEIRPKKKEPTIKWI